MNVTRHSSDDEYHPHGLDGCTCDPEGEDPHCKFHGYEAVIRRLRRQLQGAVKAERERCADAVRRAARSWNPGTPTRAILDGVLRDIGGQ